jgi:hypothetical protein
MVTMIAQRRLQPVGWGVTFRVVFCAVLTYMDLGSDLYQFFSYSSTGQAFFANATLAIFGVSMLVQLIIAIVQEHRSPPAALTGALLVISFLKPALDARRVVDGTGIQAHQYMPPTMENLISKVGEVAFESTPQALLQTWAAVLLSSSINQALPNAMQLLSIFSSVLTAAFVAASMGCESYIRGSYCPTK